MTGAAADPAAPRRLLLAGGGHAHLAVLAALARCGASGCEVRLVSPHARQIYSGMLPGWLAGDCTLEDCTIALAPLAARAGAAFCQTAVTGLDLEQGLASGADGRQFGFDWLSIDTGGEPVALPGASEHAWPVRPLERFVAAWPQRVRPWHAGRTAHRIVIVGDGAAAVELAFTIGARARREGAPGPTVRLLGRSATPMAEAGTWVSRQVRARLHAHGIDWQGDSAAARIDAGQVVLEGGRTVAFDSCVVAIGTAAPPWPAAAGLATDARGFIRVDRCLRSVSHPQVFAAGDVASYADARPKSGVYAVRAGPVLAANLLAACGQRPLRPWHAQRRALTLINTGDHRAIACWAGGSVEGRWVWRWKDRIDRAFVASARG